MKVKIMEDMELFYQTLFKEELAQAVRSELLSARYFEFATYAENCLTQSMPFSMWSTSNYYWGRGISPGLFSPMWDNSDKPFIYQCFWSVGWGSVKTSVLFDFFLCPILHTPPPFHSCGFQHILCTESSSSASASGEPNLWQRPNYMLHIEIFNVKTDWIKELENTYSANSRLKKTDVAIVKSDKEEFKTSSVTKENGRCFKWLKYKFNSKSQKILNV